MAKVEIDNSGAVGIIKDIPPHRLPPEAWSDGRNVRFKDGIAVKSLGHSNVFGTPSGIPYWAMAVTDPTNVFWMYSSLTKMFATDGTTHADITRAAGGDYAATLDRLWQGGILGGIAVVTDGVDLVQMWNAPGLGTKLATLSNWPADTFCRAIIPFKAFLVALHVTKSGVTYPHMIKWSHPAVPGAVPSSWDETDPTKDAGERNLSDSQFGVIVTGLGLRDILVIYKERATWGMQYIGGQQIMRTFPIFEAIGILGIQCVTSFSEGAKHFVATGEDVIVHNGQEKESVLDLRWKRWLTSNIDQTYGRRSFVVENPVEKEIWFCFPEVGANAPTLALVWHTQRGTVGIRELAGGITNIALGPIPGAGGGVWDTDTDTWDSDTSLWDEQTFVGYQARLLQSNKNQTKLQQMDSSSQFAGANMTAYLERSGLAITGRDRNGNPKADFDKRKLAKRIWPKVVGGPVNIRLGSHEVHNGPITWQALQAFNPDTQQYLDFTPNGRFIAVRFESNDASNWEVHGFDLEVEILGDL